MQTRLVQQYSFLPLKHNWHKQMAKIVAERVQDGNLEKAMEIFGVLPKEHCLAIIMLLDDQAAITVMTALEQDKK